jgi:hypothetical protein
MRNRARLAGKAFGRIFARLPNCRNNHTKLTKFITEELEKYVFATIRVDLAVFKPSIKEQSELLIFFLKLR